MYIFVLMLRLIQGGTKQVYKDLKEFIGKTLSHGLISSHFVGLISNLTLNRFVSIIMEKTTTTKELRPLPN